MNASQVLIDFDHKWTFRLFSWKLNIYKKKVNVKKTYERSERTSLDRIMDEYVITNSLR
jgi:hypothetical protein